jgi:signal peptidase II
MGWRELPGAAFDPEALKRGVTRGWPLFAIALVVIGLDQLTKYFVRANMDLGQSIPSEGWVRLTYVTNTGGAFGILSNQTFLLTVSAIVGIGIIVLSLSYLPLRAWTLKAGLGLVLAGAVGNLIDRLRFGAVTDFIDVGAWPVFNVADSATVVGTVLIVFYVLFLMRKQA